METSKFEKKRGRIRKKLEAIKNGTVLDTPSPCSSLSEGLDMFPESPQVKILQILLHFCMLENYLRCLKIFTQLTRGWKTFLHLN